MTELWLCGFSRTAKLFSFSYAPARDSSRTERRLSIDWVSPNSVAPKIYAKKEGQCKFSQKNGKRDLIETKLRYDLTTLRIKKVKKIKRILVAKLRFDGMCYNHKKHEIQVSSLYHGMFAWRFEFRGFVADQKFLLWQVRKTLSLLPRIWNTRLSDNRGN